MNFLAREISRESTVEVTFQELTSFTDYSAYTISICIHNKDSSFILPAVPFVFRSCRVASCAVYTLEAKTVKSFVIFRMRGESACPVCSWTCRAQWFGPGALDISQQFLQRIWRSFAASPVVYSERLLRYQTVLRRCD